MIICICRRINDSGIRDAVDAGARSPEAVQAHHGCAFNCGKCRTTIGEMISERVEATALEPLQAAAE
ncbi:MULTISPECIES: (2Fe-2S)-binding protein [Henriciella]|jgi:bacterioferritin-associated ferredoxin|uniref:Bacterioferritin-associated ferredoxin n=2 Tax=Henriciella TaxID=453849 RepID=A0A399RDA0_9PROT|nr:MULTISPECIES: (2Fe-2S)-binding protein [Henriciella]MCZ4297591.1 (2Fe-2S)-binding protein [Henriciella marina]QYI99464.1 (2Fe-2S)-binding protein [Thalassovita mediterranea]RIJ27479.1 (2Fe-2S)-binding protein [Henriciella algicola]